MNARKPISFNKLQLPAMIKDTGFKPFLTTNQVLKNLKTYNPNREANMLNDTLTWKLGYVCALRDGGRISYKVWGELVTKFHGHRMHRMVL